MKKYTCILILFFLSDCSSYNKNKCQVNIDNFFSLEMIDMSIFKGITIEYRGYDNYGNKNLRPLEYTNINRKKIRLPSSQENINLATYSYIDYAKEFGIDSIHAESFTKEKINEIICNFNKLYVTRIHSQLFLGDFVELELSKGCSIWFKKDNAYLNKTYEHLFRNAVELKPNWYILPSPIIKTMSK